MPLQEHLFNKEQFLLCILEENKHDLILDKTTFKVGMRLPQKRLPL
jgi:hypothetical protein